MDLLRKFQQILPRSFILTIYKTFIRNRLDCTDIIYYQAYNSAFHNKLEPIQYNASIYPSYLFSLSYFKGTLMQISKFLYMFVLL